jgi:hypothetical protein
MARRSSVLVVAVVLAQSLPTLAALAPNEGPPAAPVAAIVLRRAQPAGERLAALSGSVVSDVMRAAVLGVPTATATATATEMDTPTPTATASATASETASATATETDTPADTPTATNTPVDTPTPTNTAADTPTATNTPADTPTATDTPEPTATATPTTTPTSTFGVRGRIVYYRDDLPVAGTQVDLLGMPLESAMSDAGGVYVLPNVAAEMRTVQPRKTGDFNEGISSLDTALVKQIVVGIETADPFQALAADVTGNGTVSSLDAARITQFRLGIITQFAVAATCGSDWVFVPNPSPASNQTLVQPQFSPGTCQPGGIAFDPLVTPVDGQDFTAILFGDPTGNWEPANP